MEQDQPNDPPITSDPKPVLQYYTYVPSDVRLVTIRRISAMEAQLAQTKLESEGIRSFIADAHMSTMHPVMMGTAQLQVAEADVQLAEEILTRPADDDMNGDYADEDWRCPVCHRKAVELLPLSKGLRRARLVCLVLLALPLILFAIQKLLPDPQFTRVLDHGLKYWPIWLLSGSIGILVILFAKRRKRCCECGHEWAHGSSAS